MGLNSFPVDGILCSAVSHQASPTRDWWIHKDKEAGEWYPLIIIRRQKKRTFPSFPESYSMSTGHKYKSNIFALLTNLTAVGFFLKFITFWNTASIHNFKSYFPKPVLKSNLASASSNPHFFWRITDKIPAELSLPFSRC